MVRGWEATGCVVINPPVFLSEAEALELIKRELEKTRLPFDNKNQPGPGIYSIRKFDKKYLEKHRSFIDSLSKLPFFFDFFSSKYNFGVKYISKYNHSDFAAIRSDSQDEAEKKEVTNTTENGSWKMDNGVWGSSVTEYDMISAAQIVRDYLRGQKKVGVVVFYDPMVTADTSIRYRYSPDELEKIKDISKKLLSRQVSDFIKWFKKNYSQSGIEEKSK